MNSGLLKVSFTMAAAVMVAATFYFFSGSDSSATLERMDSTTTASVRVAPGVNIKTPGIARTHATSNATPRFQELRHKMQEMRDPAEFIDYALQFPEDGGLAYARTVAVECRLFAPSAERAKDKNDQANAILKAQGADTSARLQALEQLPAERCRGVASDPAMLDKVNQRVSQDGQRDPIVRTTNALHAAADAVPNEQSRRLKDVLALQDPYALDHARLFAQQLAGTNLSGGQAYLDGEHYEGERMAVWNAAWSLVRCDFGERCDENDASLAYECAYQGACARSRHELVESQFAKRPERLAEVQALRQRLNDVVRTQDAEALLPPPKEPEQQTALQRHFSK